MTSYAIAFLLAGMLAIACKQAGPSAEGDSYEQARLKMVKKQLARRDIVNQKVLGAMRKVKRHLFVPERLRKRAYDDHPLPIGHDQTISQPYIVAFMTQAIDPKPEHKVLEIGTGSGYQAAVLAELVKDVYTIEIVEPLGKEAAALLDSQGYKNIHPKVGDGYDGWPEHAPFDAIMLTAAPPKVPQPLLDQLKVGGVLIAPVGTHYQELKLYKKTKDGIASSDILPVRFVPMTGKALK